jgi:hypothetical protein
MISRVGDNDRAFLFSRFSMRRSRLTHKADNNTDHRLFVIAPEPRRKTPPVIGEFLF